MTPCKIHPHKPNRGGYIRLYTPAHGHQLAHRLAYAEANGVTLDSMAGLVVLHECDNPPCVNPEHLRLGTHGDNNRDRAAKGRSAKAQVSKRVLSDGQAEEIRTRFANRQPWRDPINGVQALSREFGVDTNVIYQIAERRTYATA